LEEAVFLLCESDDFLKVFQVIAGRLFEVKVLAGFEDGETVTGVVADGGLNGDDLDVRAFKESFAAENRNVFAVGRGFGYADEPIGGVGENGVYFSGAVRV
jgi:hypothetical protein